MAVGSLPVLALRMHVLLADGFVHVTAVGRTVMGAAAAAAAAAAARTHATDADEADPRHVCACCSGTRIPLE